MTIIAPCPICGKYPKVKYKNDFYCPHIIIRCKPLLEKAHLEIVMYEGDHTRSYTVDKAISAWNEVVCKYKPTNERKTK
jgi:hypothetical protein